MAKGRVNRFTANAKQNGINAADEILSTGKEKNLDDNLNNYTEEQEILLNDSNDSNVSTEEELTQITNASSILDRLDTKKIKKATFSLKINPDTDKYLTPLSSRKKVKPNAIIELILEDLYDPKKKRLNIDLEPNEKDTSRATSLHIDERYITAIKNTATRLNMSAAECLNKVIVKYIEDNNLIEINKTRT